MDLTCILLQVLLFRLPSKYRLAYMDVSLLNLANFALYSLGAGVVPMMFSFFGHLAAAAKQSFEF